MLWEELGAAVEIDGTLAGQFCSPIEIPGGLGKLISCRFFSGFYMFLHVFTDILLIFY
jgi:hypothetical protein